jgi:hypothetical protein
LFVRKCFAIKWEFPRTKLAVLILDYALSMPSKSRKACRRATGVDALRAQLRSPNEHVRVQALHRICPCGSGFSLYEQLLDDVKQLQKDPNLEVRRMALHVEEDACTIELIETNLVRDSEAGRRGGDADWTRRKRKRQASGWAPIATR